MSDKVSLHIPEPINGQQHIEVRRADTNDVVGQIHGTYWELREMLEQTLNELVSDTAAEQATATEVWDALFAELTESLKARYEADQVDEVLADLQSLHLTSDQWDNGWFPRSTFQGTNSAGVVVLDGNDHESEILTGGFLNCKLELLSCAQGRNGAFEPHWSYILNRPEVR